MLILRSKNIDAIKLIIEKALSLAKSLLTISSTWENAIRRKSMSKKAREIMNDHGLKEWNLVIDNARSRLGCCKYDKKTITLSKRHLDLDKEWEIIDTILHEVAHALVGPNHGHDNVWKSMCVKIGAKPNRCKSVSDDFHDDAPLVAECCNKKFYRYKKPAKIFTYRCPACKLPITFKKK